MRPVRPRPRLALLALLGACQASTADSSGFTTPGITTVSVGSTSDTAAVDSADSNGASTSTSTTTSSGDASTSASTQPVLDLGGVPDGGDGKPAGCKGKIDLLFVISRHGNMWARQAQLIAAFPEFIATIEAKFADFDYHIMVVDGDADWGLSYCTDDCPVLDCKIGQPCCPYDGSPESNGEPCCGAPDYPCGQLDLVNACDSDFGAGSVFPAGVYAANMPCPIDGGRRYMVKGQTDLADTFACVAQIGVSGGGRLGQALTAAMQTSINDPGGCNPGFLRDDALLMVTLIGTDADWGGGGLDSEGFADDWAKAVLAAKHGDPEAVVVFNILNNEPECFAHDELCKMAQMFPYWHLEDTFAADYGPAFEAAAGLVETACAGFVAPG